MLQLILLNTFKLLRSTGHIKENFNMIFYLRFFILKFKEVIASCAQKKKTLQNNLLFLHFDPYWFQMHNPTLKHNLFMEKWSERESGIWEDWALNWFPTIYSLASELLHCRVFHKAQGLKRIMLLISRY